MEMAGEEDTMTFFKSLKHRSRLEFFRQNPLVQVVVWVTIIGVHAIGFYINNFTGFVLAFSVSCLAYFGSPYVVTRMRAGGRT